MSAVPPLLIPLAVYNFVALFRAPVTAPFLWVSPTIVLSLEDILLSITLVLLGVEVWRSVNPASAKNRVAGLLVLIACIFELVLAPWCQTGTFVTLTIAVAVDLVLSTFVSFALKGRNIWVSS